MIDFHAHLDLYPDPHVTVGECIARKIYVLSVTTTPSAWTGTAALAGGAPRIRTALGLHPQIASQRKVELGLFEELLPKVRYVGEIGLDGGKEFQDQWPDQQDVFARILRLCDVAGGRILTIHSRHATTAVLDALAANPGAGTPILHWFSGTRRELQRAVDLGCWFSVGPSMLSSKKGYELAMAMPRERLLTESDGPFAQMDGRAAWPWDVERAVLALTKIWSEPTTDVQLRLEGNLKRLAENHLSDGDASPP